MRIVQGASATRPDNAISGADSAKSESALGDLVADSLKLAAKSEIALVPAGLLEEKGIPANDESPDAARAALASPAENVLTLKVTGKQLLGALERSVSLAPRKNQGFLQMAGVTVVYDPTQPENSRITDAKANGDPVKPDKTYVVAMPESLAHGALGYFKFWDDKGAKPVVDAKGGKVTLFDALAARLKAGKMSAKSADRIKAK
jgi:2',3'-cyclic-nucleotide 2'-phosphodiesterase (5'-nucleotidase family)